MTPKKEKTTSKKEISIFSSSEYYFALAGAFCYEWSAMELGEKLVEFINKKGERSPEVRLGEFLANYNTLPITLPTLPQGVKYYEKPIMIKDVDALCGKEATQISIARVLIMLSAEHNKKVRISGDNLEELTPILLEKILNYNESVRMKEMENLDS